MVVFGTSAHGQTRRRVLESNGLTIHKGEWMESGDDPVLSPTVFLIEQPPNTVLEPHFHRQNQFQLFIEGGGKIGASALAPATVHYAGAYTGYGPLVSAERGIKYFTIRPVCESGALYVKTSRSEMKRGPKRHGTSESIAPPSTEALRALASAEAIEVIAVGEDGMGARLVNLPPGGMATTTFPTNIQGAFAVVLSGSLKHDEGELQRWESVFASTEEELPQLVAGAGGASVVFLFTPARADVYNQ